MPDNYPALTKNRPKQICGGISSIEIFSASLPSIVPEKWHRLFQTCRLDFRQQQYLKSNESFDQMAKHLNQYARF